MVYLSFKDLNSENDVIFQPIFQPVRSQVQKYVDGVHFEWMDDHAKKVDIR